MPIIIGYIIVPLVLITMGIIQRKYPPQDINSVVGFRTRKSSKTQRNWDIAQQLCGKYLIISGVISAVFFTILVFANQFLKLSDITLEYLFALPAFLVIFTIVIVNKKLPD
jgi:uncharacterized membrane protein